MMYHNSFDSFFRCPAGAVPQDEIVELFIKTDEEYESCTLRLWTPENIERNYKMQRISTGYKINIEFDEVGIYWYYFSFMRNGIESCYCCREGFSGGEGRQTESWVGSFQITAYSRKLSTPEWFKNSIMYQIFPDRFNRRGIIVSDKTNRKIHYNWYEKPDFIETGSTNTDFFGGNFNGVKDKLLYLKELGINVIYFNPIFESQSNHRYDTGDYLKVDNMLGTTEEFKELIDAAGKLGIRIILDGVFSHTGSNSRYFNKLGEYETVGAFQSKDSPWYSWYKFDTHPNSYECWWGIDTLPNVNENDSNFQSFIFSGTDSVVKRWMQLGIKGWRLDVADELPDEFLNGFYASVKEVDKDAVVIGEVWEDASNKRSYGKLRQFVIGQQFDSIMNYPIRNLIIDFIGYGYAEDGVSHRRMEAGEFAARLLNLYHNYPHDIFYSLMNFLSTHDTHRIMTIFEEAEADRSLSKKAQQDYVPTKTQYDIAIRRLKLAFAFIVSMPGVPCIYYGDEIGMSGYRDPFNRGTYPWGNENLELLQFFKDINSLRNGNNTLALGTFKPIHFIEDVYAHERKLGGDCIIFIMNRNSIKAGSIHVEAETKFSYMDMETAQTYHSDISGKMTIDIGPLSYKLIRKIEHVVK